MFYLSRHTANLMADFIWISTNGASVIGRADKLESRLRLAEGNGGKCILF